MLPKPKNIEFENNGDSYVLICRNMGRKVSLFVLLLMGLFWLITVGSLKRLNYDFIFFLLSLISLLYAFRILFIAFGKSTIKVSAEKILVKRIQFPFPTKRVIETKDIEEIVCETSDWFGNKSYIKAKLKNGEKIKLFETANRDDAQFLLTALDSSVKQSQMLPMEKKVSLISNKFL